MYNLNSMLEDGYTRKFADFFLKLLEHEKMSGLFDEEYLRWCHSNGFLAESGVAYNLNENNINDYLSDYDYYKSWPLNDWQRIWINDKLTLKYMLSGTEFDQYMPRYYYYATANNGIKRLIDNPYDDNSLDSFFALLHKKKVFACKPCNGTASAGFVKLEHIDADHYCINGIVRSKERIIEFIGDNPNYLYTEYIVPHVLLGKIDKRIHTLRIVVLNKDGISPTIVSGYLRFGHNKNGEANYLHADDSMMIYSRVDFSSGEFGNTKAVWLNRIDDLDIHPDTLEKISGELPHFNMVKQMVLNISKRFFAMEFMGFDIGITEDGFKIMEINSHPGLIIPQMFSPYMKKSFIQDYFKEKLSCIDRLSESERIIRNSIVR